VVPQVQQTIHRGVVHNMTTTTKEQTLLMNRKEVVALVGLCYTSIYNLEKSGKFPARRQLSPGRVAWVRSEVTAWLEGLACVVPCDDPLASIPIENTPEPNRIERESACIEKPAIATRSRFEPLPWLRPLP